eukprot:2639561-Amphidinium_carterae.1
MVPLLLPFPPVLGTAIGFDGLLARGDSVGNKIRLAKAAMKGGVRLGTRDRAYKCLWAGVNAAGEKLWR